MDDETKQHRLEYASPEKAPARKPALSLAKRIVLWFALTFVFMFAIAFALDHVRSEAVAYILLPTAFIAMFVNPKGVDGNNLVLSNAMLYALLVAFSVRRRLRR